MPRKGGQAIFGAAVAVHLTTQERKAMSLVIVLVC